MSYAERVKRGRWVVRCVFKNLNPGQLETAKRIAYRESRFDPTAHNRSTDCRGLYQHLGRYWQARVYRYLKAKEFPNSWPRVSAFNARANAIVTARMIKETGWTPWST